MLSAISDILTGIWDFCTSVFTFVIDTVKGLADLAVNLFKLPEVFETVFDSSLIPGIVSAAVMSCLGVIITLRIIGRD